MINKKEREIREQIEELELNIEIEQNRVESVTKLLSDARHEIDVKINFMYEKREKLSERINLEYDNYKIMQNKIDKLKYELHEMAVTKSSKEIDNAKKLLEDYGFTVFARLNKYSQK